MLVTELILLIATFTVAVNIEIFWQQITRRASREKQKKHLEIGLFSWKNVDFAFSILWHSEHMYLLLFSAPLASSWQIHRKALESYFLLDLIVILSSSAHKSFVGFLVHNALHHKVLKEVCALCALSTGNYNFYALFFPFFMYTCTYRTCC